MNKYLIAISAFLNAILLMIIFGVVPLLLYLSLIVNIFLFWFARNLLREKEQIRMDFDKGLESLEIFSEHLDGIYALESFYGDQTLKNLIDHSREVINDIVDLQEKHYDIEVELESNDDNDNEEETTPQEE